MSTVFIKGKEAEVLEAMALPSSDMVEAPLKDIKLPKEALVLCLARGDQVLIPSGDTQIQPHDRVIILSTRKHLSRMEHLLMSKRRLL
jgi:trk system potassium uptake protein TrkA